MPSATVGFENFPGPNPKVPQHSEYNGQHLCLCCFDGIIPSQHWKDALLLWAGFSASSLGATQQLWEQPKPQECQGDYWPMSNLLWSRGPLSPGDRFTFLTGLIELNKSALPAQGALHSHQASSIIKKAHVFKINLFLTVSLKYLLFWHTFWFLRFCQAVMTLTSFFETLSFPLSSSIHLINWISSNEKK